MSRPDTYKVYRRSYDLSRYHDRKAKMIDYLGCMCKSCGSVDSLEIDHIDPEKKSFGLSRNWGLPWDELTKELDKCQLLCKECHLAKTSAAAKKEIHGTWGMYRNRKCRCDVCKSFVSNYSREHRRKSK